MDNQKQKRSVLDQVKDSPVVSTLAATVFLISLITGFVAATGKLDNMVMTHTEHDKDIRPLTQRVEENRLWNQCHRIELRMQRLEDRLWEREHAPNPDARVIRDTNKEIRRMAQEFEAKQCAVILDA